MRFATACSGIGVPDLAAHRLGWKPVFACEREAFPRAVLEYRFGYGREAAPPLLDDMLNIDASAWPETECFIAGTPCQSFSIAGLRGGMRDARGNLTLKFVELCHAFQNTARAFRWALWENVPGVLSDKGNAFGTFISALVGGDAPALPPGGGSWPSAGMVSGPRARLAWRILDAQYFGVPQRRRRVFVVVSFGPGDPAKVLFEPRRSEGNPSTRRKSREGTAPTLSARTNGGGGLGTDAELDGARIATSGYVPDIVGQAISSKWAKGSSGPSGDEFANLVAFSGKDYGADADPIAPTLRAMGHSGSHANAGGQVAIAYDIQERAGAEREDSGPDGKGWQEGQAFTLEARTTAQSVATPLAVRRLTPRECERCQGLPDDWTLIPTWTKKRLGWKRDLEETAAWIIAGNPGMTITRARKLAAHPDGPRYKAIGNAWAYPCGEWIMKRMTAEDAATYSAP